MDEKISNINIYKNRNINTKLGTSLSSNNNSNNRSVSSGVANKSPTTLQSDDAVMKNKLNEKELKNAVNMIRILTNDNKRLQNKLDELEKNNEIEKEQKEKEKISIDKYAFSNKVYKTQKFEYNKYLKNKQIMRGKNFSKQMGLLLKEKERYGLNDNENDVGSLPRLNYNKLLYQMQLKDLFTNSFNTLRLFNEGDQDLDLDNLNKIKQLIKEYEIEMARVMKNSDNPNCIKKRFNKSTVGKYHSSRGIYM